MKKALIIGGAVVLVAVIVFASVRGGGSKGKKVYVEPAAVRSIQAVVTATGQVDPKVKVNIGAHIVGKIEKIYFEEGQTVKRGQKLIELEKPNYIAQRDRFRSELANRRIEVQRAKAALGTAELSYRRAQSLQTQGIQTQELLDRTRLELDTARAAYDSALQGVTQGEAMLTQANEDLSRTTIVSPIDGKVVSKNANEGEVVVTGTMNNPASVIAVIADLSQILIEAEVGETEVVAIRLGQPATIKVDAVTDKEYRGRVVEIGSSAAIRQTAGTGVRYFKVKVAIDDPDDRLRPGMTSQVSIVTNSASAVAVPIQCVVERAENEDEEEDSDAPKKKYVFLARDGKTDMIEVKTGISDATHVAVTSGLKAGDPVITGPFRLLKGLKDGEAIVVTKEEKSKPTSKDDEKEDQ
ncbi:MAG TPA: efflux RND transporter periplasmic adaptor subunit [Thermoanaerobaculia bacterium]